MPTDNEYHLYSGSSWRQIHQQMNESLQERGVKESELPSYHLFIKMRKENFKEVKLPKKARMGKCELCTSLRELVLPAPVRPRKKRLTSLSLSLSLSSLSK